MKKGIPVVVFVSALVLTVILSVFFTIFAMLSGGWRQMAAKNEISQKAAEIESILDTYYIGEYDSVQMGDTVAEAMIEAAGDMWSYYIPASEYDEFLEHNTNSYCGIGIVIQKEENTDGFVITSVIENGPAWNAGIRDGDILYQAEGQLASELGLEETKNRVRGEEGTFVTLTFLREERAFTVKVERQKIQTDVAEGKILESGIGYVKILNFDESCAAQTIREIETLLKQGAKGLIFDVRNNPGGQKAELVKLLDYLLPEGVIFREKQYDGEEKQTYSDADCLNLPMAVLVNEMSYSAAEFFAAAMQEYNCAIVIGEQTVGKGRYQYMFDLSDGSLVSISVGSYYTPQGKSLQDVGITPDIAVSLTEEQRTMLYNSRLSAGEDPYLLAALEALRNG